MCVVFILILFCRIMLCIHLLLYTQQTRHKTSLIIHVTTSTGLEFLLGTTPSLTQKIFFFFIL
jgi:hypothetical protein